MFSFFGIKRRGSSSSSSSSVASTFNTESEKIFSMKVMLEQLNISRLISELQSTFVGLNTKYKSINSGLLNKIESFLASKSKPKSKDADIKEYNKLVSMAESKIKCHVNILQSYYHFMSASQKLAVIDLLIYLLNTNLTQMIPCLIFLEINASIPPQKIIPMAESLLASLRSHKNDKTLSKMIESLVILLPLIPAKESGLVADIEKQINSYNLIKSDSLISSSSSSSSSSVHLNSNKRNEMHNGAREGLEVMEEKLEILEPYIRKIPKMIVLDDDYFCYETYSSTQVNEDKLMLSIKSEMLNDFKSSKDKNMQAFSALLDLDEVSLQNKIEYFSQLVVTLLTDNIYSSKYACTFSVLAPTIVAKKDIIACNITRENIINGLLNRALGRDKYGIPYDDSCLAMQALERLVDFIENKSLCDKVVLHFLSQSDLVYSIILLTKLAIKFEHTRELIAKAIIKHAKSKSYIYPSSIFNAVKTMLDLGIEDKEMIQILYRKIASPLSEIDAERNANVLIDYAAKLPIDDKRINDLLLILAKYKGDDFCPLAIFSHAIATIYHKNNLKKIMHKELGSSSADVIDAITLGYIETPRLYFN
jgi:hypothetical protein